MKYLLSLVALCLGAVCLSGCLELVRRPPEGKPIVYGPEGAADTTGVSNHPAGVVGPPSGAAGNLSATADVQDGEDATAPTPLVFADRLKRSRQQRQSIERVNEYALWCIENAMWNEARSHLERALAQDSLSASLHNNLGIVYERLGLVDKAADFYIRAQSLSPAKKAYAANLDYLQKRQQATRDSTDGFNIFRLEEDLRRGPGTRRPDDGEPTTFTGE